MTRALWDIWDDVNGAGVCMQSINAVFYFRTKEKAERYRDIVIKNRKKMGLEGK